MIFFPVFPPPSWIGEDLGLVVGGDTVKCFNYSWNTVFYAALLKFLKQQKQIGPHSQKGTFWTEVLWLLSCFSLMQVFHPKKLTWIVQIGLDAIMYDVLYIYSP